MSAHESGPRGAPPYQELVPAYEELQRGLQIAFKVFKFNEDAGRGGAVLACHAVARFIAVRHLSPELAVPFLQMRAALKDLQQGIKTNPLLSTGEAQERARHAQKKHVRDTAAACLEALVRLENPVEQAAGRVARNVKHWPSIGTQKISKTTVMNWRDACRRLPDSERKEFDAMWQDLMAQPEPSAAVEQLLRAGPPDLARP